jgi:ribonuclease P protein component
LTASADIQALFRRGRRIERPAVTLLWNTADGTRRAGFAVTRQIKGAVHRNRARRRLREAYRAERDHAPASAALVLIAKRRAIDATFEGLRADVREALASIPGTRSSR